MIEFSQGNEIQPYLSFFIPYSKQTDPWAAAKYSSTGQLRRLETKSP
jgi:hypothetical protein